MDISASWRVPGSSRFNLISYFLSSCVFEGFAACVQVDAKELNINEQKPPRTAELDVNNADNVQRRSYENNKSECNLDFLDKRDPHSFLYFHQPSYVIWRNLILQKKGRKWWWWRMSSYPATTYKWGWLVHLKYDWLTLPILFIWYRSNRMHSMNLWT